MVEEIPSWIRESGNDRRVPLSGEEGELGGEVLLDDSTRVLCKVRGDCFALMDKCVLDGGYRRLRYIFEMARWRCLGGLGKAAANGVRPAVGHG